MDGLLVVLFFTALVFIVFVLMERQKEQIAGVPIIIDGDSIQLNGADIRLAGIDAPELRQRCDNGQEAFQCGEVAKKHLAMLVADQSVDCRVFGRDFYDRILAACFAGDTYLNSQMILDGWAIDYGGYAQFEAEASANKRGLWSGQFENPEDFRRSLGASNENSIAHHVTFAKLKAIKIGADIAKKFGLSGE